MLHILLGIVKIIGILIAIILALLLIIALVILFVPLRYEVDAKCDGTVDSLYARIRFSWCLHLLSGHLLYEEKKAMWKVRVGWKQFPSEKRPQEEVKEQERKNAPIKKDEPSPQQQKEEKPKENKKQQFKENDRKGKKETPPQKKQKKKQNIFAKIKYTFQRMYANMKVICEKKERIQEFLRNEVHRNCFSKLFREVRRLIRFLKPKKFDGRVHYGLEDPSTTGQILALLSMFYPLYGEHLHIQPDFEDVILEGELHVAGQIRVIYGLIVGIAVITDSYVKATIKDIKQFQL